MVAWRMQVLNWLLAAALLNGIFLRTSLFSLAYLMLLLAMIPRELLPARSPQNVGYHGCCGYGLAPVALLLALGGAAVLLVDGFVDGFEEGLDADPNLAAALRGQPWRHSSVNEVVQTFAPSTLVSLFAMLSMMLRRFASSRDAELTVSGGDVDETDTHKHCVRSRWRAVALRNSNAVLATIGVAVCACSWPSLLTLPLFAAVLAVILALAFGDRGANVYGLCTKLSSWLPPYLGLLLVIGYVVQLQGVRNWLDPQLTNANRSGVDSAWDCLTGWHLLGLPVLPGLTENQHGGAASALPHVKGCPPLPDSLVDSTADNVSGASWRAPLAAASALTSFALWIAFRRTDAAVRRADLKVALAAKAARNSRDKGEGVQDGRANKQLSQNFSPENADDNPQYELARAKRRRAKRQLKRLFRWRRDALAAATFGAFAATALVISFPAWVMLPVLLWSLTGASELADGRQKVWRTPSMSLLAKRADRRGSGAELEWWRCWWGIRVTAFEFSGGRDQDYSCATDTANRESTGISSDGLLCSGAAVWFWLAATLLMRFCCSFIGAPLTLALSSVGTEDFVASKDRLAWLRSAGVAPLPRPLTGLLLHLFLFLVLSLCRRAAATMLSRWQFERDFNPEHTTDNTSRHIGSNSHQHLTAGNWGGAPQVWGRTDSSPLMSPSMPSTGSTGKTRAYSRSGGIELLSSSMDIGHPAGPGGWAEDRDSDDDSSDSEDDCRDSSEYTPTATSATAQGGVTSAEARAEAREPFLPLLLLVAILSFAISARVCAINAFYLIGAAVFGGSRYHRNSATSRMCFIGGGALWVAMLYVINILPDCAYRYSRLKRFDPKLDPNATIPPGEWDQVTGLMVLRPLDLSGPDAPPRVIHNIPLSDSQNVSAIMPLVAWSENTLWPTDIMLNLIMFMLACFFSALAPDQIDTVNPDEIYQLYSQVLTPTKALGENAKRKGKESRLPAVSGEESGTALMNDRLRLAGAEAVEGVTRRNSRHAASSKRSSRHHRRKKSKKTIMAYLQLAGNVSVLWFAAFRQYLSTLVGAILRMLAAWGLTLPLCYVASILLALAAEVAPGTFNEPAYRPGTEHEPLKNTANAIGGVSIVGFMQLVFVTRAVWKQLQIGTKVKGMGARGTSSERRQLAHSGVLVDDDGDLCSLRSNHTNNRNMHQTHRDVLSRRGQLLQAWREARKVEFEVLRPTWLFILGFDTAVLVLRYIYQMPALHRAFARNWPGGEYGQSAAEHSLWITLPELGLIFYKADSVGDADNNADDDRLSLTVRVGLVPLAACLTLAAAQWQLWKKALGHHFDPWEGPSFSAALLGRFAPASWKTKDSIPFSTRWQPPAWMVSALETAVVWLPAPLLVAAVTCALWNPASGMGLILLVPQLLTLVPPVVSKFCCCCCCHCTRWLRAGLCCCRRKQGDQVNGYDILQQTVGGGTAEIYIGDVEPVSSHMFGRQSATNKLQRSLISGKLFETLHGFGSWSGVWAPLYIFATLSIFMLYLFQLSPFAPPPDIGCNTSIFANSTARGGGCLAWYADGSALAAWIGMRRARGLDSRDTAKLPTTESNVTVASMWAVIGPQITTLALCIIARVVRSWKKQIRDGKFCMTDNDEKQGQVRAQRGWRQYHWSRNSSEESAGDTEAHCVAATMSFLPRTTPIAPPFALSVGFLVFAANAHANIIGFVYLLLVAAMLFPMPLPLCVSKTSNAEDDDDTTIVGEPSRNQETTMTGAFSIASSRDLFKVVKHSYRLSTPRGLARFSIIPLGVVWLVIVVQYALMLQPPPIPRVFAREQVPSQLRSPPASWAVPNAQSFSFLLQHVWPWQKLRHCVCEKTGASAGFDERAVGTGWTETHDSVTCFGLGWYTGIAFVGGRSGAVLRCNDNAYMIRRNVTNNNAPNNFKSGDSWLPAANTGYRLVLDAAALVSLTLLAAAAKDARRRRRQNRKMREQALRNGQHAAFENEVEDDDEVLELLSHTEHEQNLQDMHARGEDDSIPLIAARPLLMSIPTAATFAGSHKAPQVAASTKAIASATNVVYERATLAHILSALLLLLLRGSLIVLSLVAGLTSGTSNIIGLVYLSLAMYLLYVLTYGAGAEKQYGDEDANVSDEEDEGIVAQSRAYAAAETRAASRWRVRRAILFLLLWSWFVMTLLILFQFPTLGSAPPGGPKCIVGTKPKSGPCVSWQMLIGLHKRPLPYRYPGAPTACKDTTRTVAANIASTCGDAVVDQSFHIGSVSDLPMSSAAAVLMLALMSWQAAEFSAEYERLYRRASREATNALRWLPGSSNRDTEYATPKEAQACEAKDLDHAVAIIAAQESADAAVESQARWLTLATLRVRAMQRLRATVDAVETVLDPSAAATTGGAEIQTADGSSDEELHTQGTAATTSAAVGSASFFIGPPAPEARTLHPNVHGSLATFAPCCIMLSWNVTHASADNKDTCDEVLYRSFRVLRVPLGSGAQKENMETSASSGPVGPSKQLFSETGTSVTISRHDAMEAARRWSPRSTCCAIIGGLEAGRSYLFQVASSGLLGESQMSPPSRVVRTPAMVTLPVALVRQPEIHARVHSCQPQGFVLVRRRFVGGRKSIYVHVRRLAKPVTEFLRRCTAPARDRTRSMSRSMSEFGEGAFESLSGRISNASISRTMSAMQPTPDKPSDTEGSRRYTSRPKSREAAKHDDRADSVPRQSLRRQRERARVLREKQLAVERAYEDADGDIAYMQLVPGKAKAVQRVRFGGVAETVPSAHWLLLLREPMAPRLHVLQKASSGMVVARPLLGTSTSAFASSNGIRPFIASRASVRDALRVEDVVAMALSVEEETRYLRYQQKERKRFSFQHERNSDEQETLDASQRLGWLDGGMVLRVWARKGEWTTSAATLADSTFGKDSSDDDDDDDDAFTDDTESKEGSRGGSSERSTLHGRAKTRLLGAVGLQNSANEPKRKEPEDKIYEYCFSFVDVPGADSADVDSRARWLLHMARTITKASSTDNVVQPHTGIGDAEETHMLQNFDTDNFLLGAGAEEEDEIDHRNWLASIGVLESEAPQDTYGDETHDLSLRQSLSSHDDGLDAIPIAGSSNMAAADVWNAAQAQRLGTSQCVLSKGAEALLKRAEAAANVEAQNQHEECEAKVVEDADLARAMTSHAVDAMESGAPLATNQQVITRQSKYRRGTRKQHDSEDDHLFQRAFCTLLCHWVTALPEPLVARFVGRDAAKYLRSKQQLRKEEKVAASALGSVQMTMAESIEVVKSGRAHSNCDADDADRTGGYSQFVHENDELPPAPRATVVKWGWLLVVWVSSWSFEILAIVLIGAFCGGGGLVAVVYPALLLGLCLPDSNRLHTRLSPLDTGHIVRAAGPDSLRWRVLTMWSAIIIVLKFIFLLPAWCFQMSHSHSISASGGDANGAVLVPGYYGLSMQPHCPSDLVLANQTDCVKCQAAEVQPLQISGLFYPPPASLANGANSANSASSASSSTDHSQRSTGAADYRPSVLSAVSWDIAVIIAVLFHCWRLRSGGGGEAEAEASAALEGHTSSARTLRADHERRPTFDEKATTVGKQNGCVATWMKRLKVSVAGVWSRVAPPTPPAEWPSYYVTSDPSQASYIANYTLPAAFVKHPRHAWRMKPGRSWDAGVLLSQIVTIVYIFFAFTKIASKLDDDVPQAASGGSSAEAGGSGQTMFSSAMVYALLVQIGLMVLDRTIAIRRAMKAKVILQWVVIVLLHLCVLIVIPFHTGIYFDHRTELIVYYLMQCAYLWFSALQIRDGYVHFDDALGVPGGTAATRGYDIKGSVPHTIYFNFPFVFEMNTLLNWCNKVTSLDSNMFLQVEEIYSVLYTTRCKMYARRQDSLVLRGYRPQPVGRKLMKGFLVFCVLVGILVAPIIVFSSVNPALNPNPVQSATATLTLISSRDGQRYQIYQSTSLLSQPSQNGQGHDCFKPSDSDPPHVIRCQPDNDQGCKCATYSGGTGADVGSGSKQGKAKAEVLPLNFTPALLSRYPSSGISIQFLQFHRYSPEKWAITDPALDSLQKAVRDATATQNNSFDWELSIAFNRVGPPSAETMRWAVRRPLFDNSVGKNSNLARALNVSDGVTQALVPAYGLYQPVLYLGAEGAPAFSSVDGSSLNAMANLTVTYVNTTQQGAGGNAHVKEIQQAYWQITQLPNANEKLDCAKLASANTATNQADYEGGMCMLLVSPGYQPVSGLLGLANAGIGVIYFYILFTIGAQVRKFFLFGQANIMFSELPDTELLLGICDGIRIARGESYQGHLKDEVRLFETLIKLYRSPETLLKLTGDKIINLPPGSREGMPLTDKLKID